MPVNAVAKQVGEHDTRLWRILKHYVKEARTKADYSSVRKIWLGQSLNFGIPPLQGIIVAALMVPVTNALFKAVGSNDAHQLKNNISIIEPENSIIDKLNKKAYK